jgi:hypothetical protein
VTSPDDPAAGPHGQGRRALSLHELQQSLAAAIRDPATADAVATHLCPPPRGTIETRLAAYIDGYPARVREAVEDSCPALAHLLGPGAFAGLIERFLGALPAGGYNLNDVPRGLPTFLRADRLATELPFTADLAQLEIAILDAFHAHLLPPFDPTPLATLGLEQWAEVRLVLQAGVDLVRSDWPIRELWAARETALEDLDIDLRDRPDCVLVYRAGLDVRCESIAAAEAAALAAARERAPLTTLAATLADHGASPDGISDLLASWIQRGLVAACEVPAAAR